ncbi:MAG TPA: response regulator transcription factor [Gaiellaceae bacterium]|nr:response regulator transcription factor [Gaiellaceae bacterium]
MKPITVLVADDHPPTRAGIRASLENDGFVVCAEVADGAAAVAAAIRERPDLCLLDIHMPGNGISAAKEITARVPETAVVVLTVSRDDEDVFDALRAGASGYLLKDMDAARLPAALKGVLKGEAALPRRLVARLVDEFRERGRKRRVPILAERGPLLTAREWEVLELMQSGLTTAQISERLVISPATVRSHVASILRKLGAPNREAALRLLDAGPA